MSGLSAVILAAGFGKRMRSERHKVLHELVGVPMITHVIRAARAVNPDRIVVVVGHEADQVIAALRGEDVEFVHQHEQLGTAHAFLQAAPLLAEQGGRVLVLSGDSVLLGGKTLKEMVALQGDEPSMTLLTCRVEDPTGLGRVLTGEDGLVRGVVEHRDASPEQLAIHDIVVGTYLFDGMGFALAEGLQSENAAGEYYITDMIAAYRRAGSPVRAQDTPTGEYRGPNDRKQLAEAEELLLERIRDRWMLAGVTMHMPATVYIEDPVVLAADVTLQPGVVLRGNTRVGRGASIGAGSVLTDAHVAEGIGVPPLSHLQGYDK